MKAAATVVTSEMADGAGSSDGHGGVPSNNEQDNNAHERPSTGAVRGQVLCRRRPKGISVLATGRVHPADARNLINPTPNTIADGQTVTDAANVGGAPWAVDAANVGGVAIAATPRGNLVADIQAGVGVIANAVSPFVGPHNAGVVPAAQGPAELNLGGVATVVAPPAPALAQPYFDIESGLSAPPLRRSEVGPFF